ncbi:hypothetical protein E2320_004612 [Naja naja]|nr:hypothetical protein E2320_004612 [Naja naja]
MLPNSLKIGLKQLHQDSPPPMSVLHGPLSIIQGEFLLKVTSSRLKRSFDLSNAWSQSNLHRTSGQFSSVGSMDIWDHTPQTYQYGQISAAKSNSSIDHLGNPSKRDSAYGSFSTSSSTPDHTLSSVDALSTENVMYKVGNWETPKQGNSKTVSFLSDNGKSEEKVNSFATLPQYENNLSSRLEDHTNSVYSGVGRSNFVPVCTDVRFPQSVYESQHHHQRQYSDEYSFFHNSKASASSKEPKWLFSYSDIRERPSDKPNCHLNQTRIPSNATTAVSDMSSEENPGLNHYYCVKARQQPAQGTSKPLQFKMSVGILEQEILLLLCQRAHGIVNKGEDIKAAVLEDSRKINYSEKSGQTFEENLSSHQEYKDGQEYFQVSDTKTAQKDFQWNREKNYHISPQKTPMLHSLTQEEKKQINVAAEIGINKQTAFDSHLSKNARRSDRFATTLRNEIQMKRAKLQKAKAQQPYRDLEPNSADYLPDRKTNIYNTSPLTFVSEDELGFPELRQSSKEISLSNAAHQLSRIGARKRFTAEQKLKSYSEPEKINEVGMSDDNCQTHHRPTTSEEALETFADKWKFFEETSKPVYQKSSQRCILLPFRSRVCYSRRNSNEIESGGSWYKKRMRSASCGVENVLCASDRPSETVCVTVATLLNQDNLRG